MTAMNNYTLATAFSVEPNIEMTSEKAAELISSGEVVAHLNALINLLAHTENSKKGVITLDTHAGISCRESVVYHIREGYYKRTLLLNLGYPTSVTRLTCEGKLDKVGAKIIKTMDEDKRRNLIHLLKTILDRDDVCISVEGTEAVHLDVWSVAPPPVGLSTCALIIRLISTLHKLDESDSYLDGTMSFINFVVANVETIEKECGSSYGMDTSRILLAMPYIFMHHEAACKYGENGPASWTCNEGNMDYSSWIEYFKALDNMNPYIEHRSSFEGYFRSPVNALLNAIRFMVEKKNKETE